MSDIRDPERDQVAPVTNDGPSCHDLVIADMEERKAHGLRKYNSLLQPNNGRSMLQDAYEEILDLAAYMRGMLEEERMANLVWVPHASYRVLDPRGDIWLASTNSLAKAHHAMMPGHILEQLFSADNNYAEWRKVADFDPSMSQSNPS